MDPVTGRSPYSVTIRDRTYTEVKDASGYAHLYAKLVGNGICEWTLDLMGDHPAAPFAATAGSGIVIRPAGSATVLMSGNTELISSTYSGEYPHGKVSISGLSDEAALARELVYPNSGTDVSSTALTTFPSVTSSEGAVPAETAIINVIRANMSSLATQPRRAYPWLTVPSSQARGTTITRKDRMNTVLESVQRSAALGGLAFAVRQSAPGRVSLVVWVPVVRDKARWSLRAHNIVSGTVTLRAPEVDEVIVGAGDEGTPLTRVFTRRSRTDLSTLWGRRRVRFLDQGSSTTLADLRVDADEALAEGASTAGITFDAVETPGLRFGEHYDLMDIGTASLPGVDVTDNIRQVVIDHTAGTAAKVSPSVGLPDPGEDEAWVKPVTRALRQIGPTARR